MKHRIVIVEDHEALLEAMTLMLEASQKFRVEGRYKNAEEAMVHIPQLRPDAVLMDINLPRLSGIECVSQLKSRCPEILFVMCTSFEDDQKIFESLEAGASGYILKTDGPVRIISALEDLFEGGSPMSASIARKVVNSFSKFSKKPNVEMELLTEREREILDLIAKGFFYN